MNHQTHPTQLPPVASSSTGSRRPVLRPERLNSGFDHPAHQASSISGQSLNGRFQLMRLWSESQMKSPSELIRDLKQDFEPQVLPPSQAFPSFTFEKTAQELERSVSDQFMQHQSARMIMRSSFRSRDDFRNSNDSNQLNDSDLLTPTRRVPSRTTSMGVPEQVKNNLLLVLNDSISSNQTRPSQDKQVGLDESAVQAAEPAPGMLSLADNREVSPAPVSHFALKSHGNNMGSNRVSLPFNRVDSFKPTTAQPILERLTKTTDPVSVDVNFKFLQPDQNAASLTQLINNHGIGIKGGSGPAQRGLLSQSDQEPGMKRSQSQDAFSNMKKLCKPDLKVQVSNLSSNLDWNTPTEAIQALSALLPNHGQTNDLKIGPLHDLKLPSGLLQGTTTMQSAQALLLGQSLQAPFPKSSSKNTNARSNDFENDCGFNSNLQSGQNELYAPLVGLMKAKTPVVGTMNMPGVFSQKDNGTSTPSLRGGKTLCRVLPTFGTSLFNGSIKNGQAGVSSLRDETPYFEERQSDEKSRRRDTKQKIKHGNAVKRILTFESALARSQDSYSSGQDQILNPEGATPVVHSDDRNILQSSFRQGGSKVNQGQNSDQERNEELQMIKQNCGQKRFTVRPPRLQAPTAPRVSPQIKEPAVSGQDLNEIEQLSLIQLRTVSSLQDRHPRMGLHMINQKSNLQDCSSGSPPSDNAAHSHSGRSSNKRVHASTLQKTMQARQRLQELECQSMPQKRARHTSDSHFQLAKTHTIGEKAVQNYQTTISPLDNSFTQALQIHSSDVNMNDYTNASVEATHAQLGQLNQGESRSGQPGHKPCNCRKSKCLKLYCECFANNRHCGPACACVCCHNAPKFDNVRLHAKQQILMRNPHAFRQSKVTATQPQQALQILESTAAVVPAQEAQQVQSYDLVSQVSSRQGDGVKHFKGCNCRKTRCQKNYCECFQAGVACSDLCSCDNCKNCGENQTKENVKGSENTQQMAMQRSMSVDQDASISSIVATPSMQVSKSLQGYALRQMGGNSSRHIAADQSFSVGSGGLSQRGQGMIKSLR